MCESLLSTRQVACGLYLCIYINSFGIKYLDFSNYSVRTQFKKHYNKRRKHMIAIKFEHLVYYSEVIQLYCDIRLLECVVSQILSHSVHNHCFT